MHWGGGLFCSRVLCQSSSLYLIKTLLHLDPASCCFITKTLYKHTVNILYHYYCIYVYLGNCSTLLKNYNAWRRKYYLLSIYYYNFIAVFYETLPKYMYCTLVALCCAPLLFKNHCKPWLPFFIALFYKLFVHTNQIRRINWLLISKSLCKRGQRVSVSITPIIVWLVTT